MLNHCSQHIIIRECDKIHPSHATDFRGRSFLMDELVSGCKYNLLLTDQFLSIIYIDICIHMISLITANVGNLVSGVELKHCPIVPYVLVHGQAGQSRTVVGHNQNMVTLVQVQTCN